MLNVAVGLLAFFLALAADYLEAGYVRSVDAWGKGDDSARHRAANYSCAMLLVSGLGLCACVEVGWWLLIPELLGLRVGTLLALRRRPSASPQ